MRPSQQARLVDVFACEGEGSGIGECRRYDVTIPAGDAGTDAVAAEMVKLAWDGARQRELAAEAAVLAGRRSYDEKLGALWAYLKRGFLFQPDPMDRELLWHPLILLRQLQTTGQTKGDCDDRSTFACALMIAMDVPCQLCVIARHATSEYEHVFPMVVRDRKWVPFDSQEASDIGAWPATAARAKTYTVFDG